MSVVLKKVMREVSELWYQCDKCNAEVIGTYEKTGDWLGCMEFKSDDRIRLAVGVADETSQKHLCPKCKQLFVEFVNNK